MNFTHVITLSPDFDLALTHLKPTAGKYSTPLGAKRAEAGVELMRAGVAASRIFERRSEILAGLGAAIRKTSPAAVSWGAFLGVNLKAVGC